MSAREELRKKRELEEARKAGTAPAELDEDGKPINPHIPQYISQAPWYMDTGKPGLGHQRLNREYDSSADKLNKWYDRSAKGYKAQRFRKGACENCGAMGHSKKDCVERPRKRGANKTNSVTQADDVVHDIATDFDAKRDRWNGYDPSSHKRVVEEYAAVEDERRRIQEDELDKQNSISAAKKVVDAGKQKIKDEFGSSDEDEDDEDKYADNADAVGQNVDANNRITVRNLRIREDTAKYLMNLDIESAHYDPKTRSMREAPHSDVKPEDSAFAGENYVRDSGDAAGIQNTQLFAWQSASRGHDMHVQANPTATEMAHGAFKVKKEEIKDTHKNSMLNRYGGEEYLSASNIPREIRLGQTDEYVEYSRSGQLLKGKERAVAKSKYEEDVFPGNHSSVFGSWFSVQSKSWGYKCCHSTIYTSYCQGEAGKEAAKTTFSRHEIEEASKPQKSLADQHKDKIAAGTADLKGRAERDGNKYGFTKDPQALGDLDNDKLKIAVDRERRRKENKLSRVELEEEAAKVDGGKVTAEDIEAQRLVKLDEDDPLRHVNANDVLPL
ncbi:hypothetical protein E3P92_01481 [Wallemia ichthyophaga]|uniref:Pre-mRNA-splicing factor SLU7 n=2 Tax=Wallemia ichthyophaga TaxID=245174 RepID=A0A4T0IQI4_WALIC|nr:Pre-mRNA-splicing factor SLU7 [Wallemia ichthyophaga EXF-994]TIA74017.1 hypothetical protein E3P91_01124 [Wallemia ichthyophaga]EOR00286.1 Pre-mRNA-splicing factor SLU7 [Wallemia ichthyophaga EXF-994]TIA82576.1 hypothetical protein E3P98_01264 [Wallemia ichthyophaga]TIA92416.1 hypothetical protein E3P97_01429 [Wallemia ichthyophaga]TIB01544.1 hypothetical protein E3P95_01266 [Wallemia ichthyophaga]